MRTATVLATGLLGFAGFLPAADLFDYKDLRVGAATVGTSSEVRSTAAGSASTTTKEKWDSAQRLSLDAVVGVDLVLIGVAGGVGIVHDRRRGDGTSESAYTGRIEAGPYLDFGPLTLEVLGQVGLGNATLSRDGLSDSTATRTEYGAVLNVLFPIPALPLVVGANVGVVRSESSHSFNVASVPTDLKLTDADYTAGILVGWRF